MSWGRIATITGALIGVITLGGFITPYLKSDPAPLAGTDRVESLNKQIAASLLDVQKAQARIVKHQSDADSALLDLRLSLNEMRQRAVQRDVAQTADDLAHHPSDQSLKEALDRDKQDIVDIALEHKILMSEKLKRY